jgi:membrane protein implicated in regulation of membrane protease activity
MGAVMSAIDERYISRALEAGELAAVLKGTYIPAWLSSIYLFLTAAAAIGISSLARDSLVSAVALYLPVQIVLATYLPRVLHKRLGNRDGRQTARV